MGRRPAGARQYELLASWNAPVPCPANRANLPIAAARIPARGTGSNTPLGRAWSLRSRNRSLFHLLCVCTIDAEIAPLGAAALGCDLITTNKPGRLVALRERGLLRRPR